MKESNNSHQIPVSIEDQYQKISQLAKLGYWYANMQDKKMYWGENLYRLLGYEADFQEVSEYVFLEHILPHYRNNFVQAVENAIQTKASFKIEFQYKTLQQEIKWGVAEAKPLVDNLNNLIAYDGIFQEITDKKLLENQLIESEEKYRTLAENFPNGSVIIYNRELRYLLADGKGLKEAGLSKEMLEGKTIWEVFPHEICTQIEPAYRKALNGEYSTLEVAFAGKVYITHHMPIVSANIFVNCAVVMTQDITQSKVMLQQLIESEERFRTIFSEDKLVKLLINPATGEIVEANHAAENYYGYNHSELVSMKISQINQLSQEEIEAEMERALIKRKNFFRFKHKLKSGEIRHVEVYSRPIFLDNTHILHSTIIDVDERVKSETELIKLYTGIDQSASLISITDIEGNIEYVNKRFQEVTGFTFDEIKGKNHSILQSNLTPKNVYPLLWETILSGKIWRGEFVNKTKAGTIYHERAVITPVRDTEGNLINFIAVKEDISELKKIEQALTESEYKYRNLVEHAPVGIGISRNGKIVFANKALLQIFGYTNTEEFLKVPVFNHIYYKDIDMIRDLVSRINQGIEKMPFSTNYRIVKKNGDIRHLTITSAEVYINNQKHFQGFFIDNTERIKIEQSHRKMVADSIYINQKNKLIAQMLEKSKDIFKTNKLSTQDKQEIAEIFQSFSDTDKDWKKLMQHFEIIDKDFFKKLEKHAPELTQNEIRHCAYIRMNFSTKEIARLFNVKDTSIQIARYRLKKRLKINPQDNLIHFIHKF